MTQYAHIAGWGMYVPERILTNDELSQMVDTSDEWIRTRTGIVERRIAGERETTSTMAIEAARRALLRADVAPGSIDAIIVATVTPDYVTPSTACLVQAGLGAENAAALDLGAGCSGFVYGLGVARMGIESGEWRVVLVIGAETLSRITNWEDRDTCVLFGDGAGAVVITAGESPGGILSAVMGADGSGADLLIVPAGGSHQPATAETVAGHAHFLHMDGRAVFRFATRAMPDAILRALEKASLTLEEVDLVIPHQANTRIIESARKRLSLPEEAFFENLSRYGNTSAASIPIALCEAASDELVNDGSLLILVGFGAGLTWAAAAVRWGVPLPIAPARWWQVRWQRVRFALARIPMRIRRVLYHLWRILPFGQE
jgi:3-oxoacyl-[acyl-carrier-protein] synthase III